MSLESVEKPTSTEPLDVGFTIANAIGIVLFLLLASRGWRDPSEADIPFTGEPMVWSLALPVLGVFILANVTWAGLILRHRKSERWFYWLSTGGVWLLALYFDNSHH